MRKTVVALQARRGPEQLHDLQLTLRRADESASTCDAQRFAIDLPADAALYDRLGRRPQHAPDWQAVAHLWHESDDHPSVLGDDFNAVHAWRVDEQVAWDYDRTWPDGVASPGVKQISFVGKRPDITDRQFVARYRAHVEIARVHHSGVWKYAQNIVSRRGDDGTSAVGAISEFWFRSVDDLINRYYTFDNSSAVTRADSVTFLDSATTTWMLVQEYWMHS